MNERRDSGGARTVPWPEDAVEEALDRYAETVSSRMNKEVRLKESFRESVREMYALTEDDAEQHAERVEERDRERIACPACAETADAAEERGLDHAADPALTTRAYAVKQGEDEDRDAVLERAMDRPDDTIADAEASGGVGAEGYAQLCEEDRMEGLMYRETGCSEHGSYSIAMVAEGEARMEDGQLRPNLAPE